MEKWKATIKEKGNKHLLTPEYWFQKDGMFSGFADERQREYEIRKFLRKFWGLLCIIGIVLFNELSYGIL